MVAVPVLSKSLIKWKDPKVRTHLEASGALNTAAELLLGAVIGDPGIGKSTFLNHCTTDNAFRTGAGGQIVTAGADVHIQGKTAYVDVLGIEQASNNMNVLKLIAAILVITDELILLVPTPTRIAHDNTLNRLRDILSIVETRVQRNGCTYGRLHVVYSNYSSARHQEIVDATRDNHAFLHAYFRSVKIHTLPHPTAEHNPIEIPWDSTTPEYKAAFTALKRDIFSTPPTRSGAVASTLLHATIDALNKTDNVPFRSIRVDVFEEQYRKKIQTAVNAQHSFSESDGKRTMKHMVNKFYLDSVEACKAYIKQQALHEEDIAHIFQRCERETILMVQEAVECVRKQHEERMISTSAKSRAHPGWGPQEARQNGRTFSYRRCNSCRCAITWVPTGCTEYTTYTMREWDSLVVRPVSSVYSPTASCNGVVDCNHKPYGQGDL